MGIKAKIFFGGAAIFIGCFILFFSVRAQDTDQYGFHETARKTPIFSLSLSHSTPEALAENIVRAGLFFIGTIFFLLFLYGGFIWLSARGASERVNTAKQILEAAIIGLVVVVASYAVSIYIFNRLASAPDSPAVVESTE